MTSSLARGAALGALCLCVAGCAYSPWAVPPKTVSRPFGGHVEYEQGKTSLTMNAVATSLTAYIDTIDAVRGNKGGWSQGFSDTTFAGAMTAVVGGIASRTALINVGAGIAGVGLATDQHYATEKQSDAYAKAEKRLVCILNRVRPVTDDLIDAGLESTADDEVRDNAANAINTVIDAVDSVRSDLLGELEGLRSTAPSPSDLSDFFKRYNAAHAAAVTYSANQRQSMAANLTDTKTQAIKRLALLKTFPNDITACLKTIS